VARPEPAPMRSRPRSSMLAVGAGLGGIVRFADRAQDRSTIRAAAALGDRVNVRPPTPAPPAPSRGLATVVFTDIDGSTEMADQLGDRRWQQC